MIKGYSLKFRGTLLGCCCKSAVGLVMLLILASPLYGQNNTPPDTVAGIPVNYDEAKVGRYVLPDPLTLEDGQKVTNAQTWYKIRRPQILNLYKEFQYGYTPGSPRYMKFDVFDKGTKAFHGTAIRRQVTIYFTKDKNGPPINLLIYVPANAKKPVPILLSPSFFPNYSRVDDPGVRRGEMWNRHHKKVPAPKITKFGKLNVPLFINNGFGIATFYYDDIEPDFNGGRKYGVEDLYLKPGQQKPAANQWGAISAWAWGLSRAMDYLETDKQVDSKRVALFGISRLGKTVLWAGARDQRFAMVIASCSGEGGAALSRRDFGETIAHLTAPSRYPYQFCRNYGMFAHFVDELPVDGNMLISLIAPRPVLLQTGDQDLWSDPKGEFLAAVAAGKVYRLLGKQGLGTDKWPPAGKPILHTLGYYMHHGGHGTVASDWNIFLKFLQKYLVKN